MSIFGTMLVGIAGSFAAGLVSLLIFDGRSGGGILLSVVFAAGIVYLVRRSPWRRAHVTRHGPAPAPAGRLRPLTRPAAPVVTVRPRCVASPRTSRPRR